VSNTVVGKFNNDFPGVKLVVIEAAEA